MCLQPSVWLAKVTQGPVVGHTLRLGASFSVLGFHVSVCTLEFSVYYGPPSCVICGAASQDTWVIRTLCDKSNYYPAVAVDTVRATTFVLLFGVGSFLCYKIFHHLRRNKKSKKTKCLLEEADAESVISEVSSEGCHSSGSFGDGEASTDTLSLTDSEDDDVMGLSPSSHLEPVFFSKNSGIHFRKPPICPSTPVDVLGGSPRISWLEQSNDTSLSYEYDGAASLRGNFSPGSLQERTRRTQEFLESSGDEFFSDSKLPQYHHCDLLRLSL